MDDMREWEDGFVRSLESIRDREDRGALAALRQGLGKEPGTVVAMFPYVEPQLRQEADDWERQVSYLISSLFASHPLPGGKGNLGESLCLVKTAQHSEAMDARFIALLDCHPDDFGDHLRHAISLCGSKEVPIEWRQLLHDALRWNDSRRSVQRRWASSYWFVFKEIKEGKEESTADVTDKIAEEE